MVLHQTRASQRFLTTLTKFDLKSISCGPKNPNFDPTVRTDWNQYHCKDYQIRIPTTVHELKSELVWLRYHKNRDDTPINAMLTSKSHNFWSDRWIFKFHTFSGAGIQNLSKGIKSTRSEEFGGWRPFKGRRLKVRVEVINSPRHLLNLKRPHFFEFCSLPGIFPHVFLSSKHKKHPKTHQNFLNSSLFTKKNQGIVLIPNLFFHGSTLGIWGLKVWMKPFGYHPHP